MNHADQAMNLLFITYILLYSLTHTHTLSVCMYMYIILSVCTWMHTHTQVVEHYLSTQIASSVSSPRTCNVVSLQEHYAAVHKLHNTYKVPLCMYKHYA